MEIVHHGQHRRVGKGSRSILSSTSRTVMAASVDQRWSITTASRSPNCRIVVDPFLTD